VIRLIVAAARRFPVQRPDRGPQHRRQAGRLLGRRAILERRPRGAFGRGGLERQQHVVPLVRVQLQVGQGAHQDAVPALEQGAALFGRQLLAQKAELRGKLSPFLDAGLGGGAVPQKLTDAAQERLVLVGIRAMAESCTPAGSFSHVDRILAQGRRPTPDFAP
jgi:hypothetical protein